MAFTRIPRTRHEKGRFWASVTLFLCGAFSIWANVRSGQLHTENVIVSVWPPIVAFLSSHLISYFSPKTKGMKAVVYGGFGLISLISMYGSGYHIVETVVATGQPWQTAIAYIFMTDAPMLLAAGILVQKVPTSASVTNRTKVATPAKQTTATVPAKKTTPAKTTTAKKPTTTPKPAITTIPTFSEATA